MPVLLTVGDASFDNRIILDHIGGVPSPEHPRSPASLPGDRCAPCPARCGSYVGTPQHVCRFRPRRSSSPFSRAPVRGFCPAGCPTHCQPSWKTTPYAPAKYRPQIFPENRAGKIMRRCGTDRRLNGLSGQNLTSGANSPDPAQDSQASDQPVPGRPFSLLARRGSLLAFPRGVQAMNREREIQIIAEEICAQVPGAMLSVNKVPHGSSHRHL